MELKVKHYVDDETLEIVCSKHYINDEEVTPEDFTELLVGCIEAGEDEFEGIEDCKECDCEDCSECDNEDLIEDDDSDDAEFNMICAWADVINDNDLCPSCVYTVVQDAYMTGKRIGRRDQKLEMIENLSKEIDG